MHELIWWGYRHTSGTIHAKRFFSNDDISDARESPFVAQIVPPFPANSREEAIEFIMPIRLLPMHTANSRMLPFMLIQFVIRWSRYLAANSKQGTESVVRVEAPVKSESELVQVGL